MARPVFSLSILLLLSAVITESGNFGSQMLIKSIISGDQQGQGPTEIEDLSWTESSPQRKHEQKPKEQKKKKKRRKKKTLNEEDPSQTGEPTAAEVLRKRDDDSRMDAEKDVEDPNTMTLREKEMSQLTPLKSEGNDEAIQTPAVYSQEGKKFFRKQNREWRRKVPQTEEAVGTKEVLQQGSKTNAGRKVGGAKPRWGDEEEGKEIQPTPVRVGKGLMDVDPPRSQRTIASPHLLTISSPNSDRFSEK